MSKKLPLTDFRAVRSKLEPHEFAFGGEDVPPSDLVDPDIWHEIMILPEDVSISTSDHSGQRLQLMHQLWREWLKAIGDPEKPDEMAYRLLEASECFQSATFNCLHGFYRTALTELRTAIELVIIGTYGTLYPSDKDYLQWKAGKSEIFGFTRCRKRLFGNLKKEQAKWMFKDGELLALMFQTLCSYTHAHPGAGYDTLWDGSNGPIYNNEAFRLTFLLSLSVHALCYLLIRLGRPDFVIPQRSNILFRLDWMSDYAPLVQAYADLYGKPPKPPLRTST